MKKLETKSTVLLKHHLKALKMPTMHDECEKVAVRCAGSLGLVDGWRSAGPTATPPLGTLLIDTNVGGDRCAAQTSVR